MKTKIIASIFALTAFASLAQPTLPTTNSFIVPIANPYSGSWIYYTTNADSGLGFLNGASISFVMTASNNIASFALANSANGTNYILSTSNFLYLAAQDYANGIGANGTNFTLSASNFLYLAAQSFANGIGANDTNYTLSTSNLLYLAAQNYANGIGANVTNYTASVSNSLATLTTDVNTWGTTTNKTSGAAPATVYYYFTNGYPMFGIISTNY